MAPGENPSMNTSNDSIKSISENKGENNTFNLDEFSKNHENIKGKLLAQEENEYKKELDDIQNRFSSLNKEDQKKVLESTKDILGSILEHSRADVLSVIESVMDSLDYKLGNKKEDMSKYTYDIDHTPSTEDMSKYVSNKVGGYNKRDF